MCNLPDGSLRLRASLEMFIRTNGSDGEAAEERGKRNSNAQVEAVTIAAAVVSLVCRLPRFTQCRSAASTGCIVRAGALPSRTAVMLSSSTLEDSGFVGTGIAVSFPEPASDNGCRETQSILGGE